MRNDDVLGVRTLTLQFLGEGGGRRRGFRANACFGRGEQ